MRRRPPPPPSIFRRKPASIPMRRTRKLRNCSARHENVYVWHPACGLIGFEPGDRRRVADLLEAPPEHKVPWNPAQPGIRFSRRLTAIEPDGTPSAESVLREGQGDIGSQSSALGELPPGPGEPPANPLARMAAAVRRQLTNCCNGPGQKREESGGEGQSPDEGDGRPDASESTSVERRRRQHPGEGTSVELVAGRWAGRRRLAIDHGGKTSPRPWQVFRRTANGRHGSCRQAKLGRA